MNYISKKKKKKKKGCTIPEEIDGGDVAMLALGKEIILVGTTVLTADWWLRRWLEAAA